MADLKNVRLTFYGLVHFLIRKKCFFVLETSNGFTFCGRKDHDTVSHITFPELPTRHENMFVPICKLEEVVQNLGVDSLHLCNAKIACHKHHFEIV